MLYVGLDLHKRFSVTSVLSKEGEVMSQRKLPNEEGRIIEFFKTFEEPLSIAMEATSNWYWLYDLLEAQGYEVKLSHPLKTKAIASAKVKTDKIDSLTLAHLLRTNLLPSSYIPKKPLRSLREILRYRASLVSIKTQVKNKVHAILAKNNITHPFSDLFGKEGLLFLKFLKLEPSYQKVLQGYLELLETLKVQIKEVSEEIEAKASSDPQAKLLMTIPGVGYYSALLILSEIGDIKRFPSARKLASYAGLVSSTYSSGNTCYHGRITKQGSPSLRWIMIEATLQLIRKPSPFQKFYLKLARKKGSKLARVATARKLLTNIYYMLKNNETYSLSLKKKALIQGAGSRIGLANL